MHTHIQNIFLRCAALIWMGFLKTYHCWVTGRDWGFKIVSHEFKTEHGGSKRFIGVLCLQSDTLHCCRWVALTYALQQQSFDTYTYKHKARQTPLHTVVLRSTHIDAVREVAAEDERALVGLEPEGRRERALVVPARLNLVADGWMDGE